MTTKGGLGPIVKPLAKYFTLLLTRPQWVPSIREEYPGIPQVLQDTDALRPSVEEVVHFEEDNSKTVHISLEVFVKRNT